MKNTLKRFIAAFSACLIFFLSVLPFNISADSSYSSVSSLTSLDLNGSGLITINNLTDIAFTYADPGQYCFPNSQTSDIFLAIYSESFYTYIFFGRSSYPRTLSIELNRISPQNHGVYTYITRKISDNSLCLKYGNSSSSYNLNEPVKKIILNTLYFPSPPVIQEPDFDPLLTPLIESTSSIIKYKTGFLEWVNTYGKLSVINSKGFKFVSSQLDTLVDLYNSYGNSPVFFFSSLTKTFNITTDIRGAYALLVTIRDLYQEYLDWKNSDELLFTIPKPSVTDSHPHWRDQEDYNLVTDTEEDTPVISILRDILRTLIYLPQNIASYFNFLEIRFNDIIYNFQSQIYLLNNLPDQISSLTYNSLINPLTEIKDAINNIDVSSPDVSVDVSISEEKQNEINTFFSDWNVKYSTAINEKIPVISQLSGLFNDQFFEKCGIDTNGDGQVYQYYSTSVSYDSSSVSGTSSDSVSESDDVVNLLCSQFDNSDPNFLDDVSYSEDVPSLSISIAGKKTEIFDFRLFAKYRTQIHTIMIFCIYSLYFLSLYKSLPSIIGNVSDVSNAFSDYKQSKKE